MTGMGSGCWSETPQVDFAHVTKILNKKILYEFPLLVTELHFSSLRNRRFMLLKCIFFFVSDYKISWPKANGG